MGCFKSLQAVWCSFVNLPFQIKGSFPLFHCITLIHLHHNYKRHINFIFIFITHVTKQSYIKLYTHTLEQITSQMMAIHTVLSARAKLAVSTETT